MSGRNAVRVTIYAEVDLGAIAEGHLTGEKLGGLRPPLALFRAVARNVTEHSRAL
ncbi:MAG: hypothetical protein WKF82_05995 [Nocardioidaceae bacterium]